MSAKKKCSVRDRKFVEPCKTLDDCTEYGHPRGKQKGIYAWAYSNHDGPTRTFYGVKSGDHNTKGLIFNYCPFCGEQIDAPVLAKDEK